MKVLIVEDEFGVAQNLQDLLQDLEPGIEILDILESVEETVEWIKTHESPDLGFFDIRLADGSSFEIFEKQKVQFPVIFTTAYDEFALKAFKVNSIDYLLKPIGREAIKFAINKYKSLYKTVKKDNGSDGQDSGFGQDQLLRVIREMNEARKKQYKKSFLFYIKDKIKPISTTEIAFIGLQNEQVYCITFDKVKYTLDQSLEKIMTQLDPDDFFRANRQFIISRQAVISAAQFENRKLLLQLSPIAPKDVLISKSRVSEFKKWLTG